MKNEEFSLEQGFCYSIDTKHEIQVGGRQRVSRGLKAIYKVFGASRRKSGK